LDAAPSLGITTLLKQAQDVAWEIDAGIKLPLSVFCFLFQALSLKWRIFGHQLAWLAKGGLLLALQFARSGVMVIGFDVDAA